MAGMPGEEDLETKKHRKYENSARREYELAKADLLASQKRGATGVADPALGPRHRRSRLRGTWSQTGTSIQSQSQNRHLSRRLPTSRCRRRGWIPSYRSWRRPARNHVPIGPRSGSLKLRPPSRRSRSWIGWPFCRKRFSSRAMPRGRRHRNRAAIAATVGPRKSRPARPLVAGTDELDGSAGGDLDGSTGANQGRTGPPNRGACPSFCCHAGPARRKRHQPHRATTRDEPGGVARRRESDRSRRVAGCAVFQLARNRRGPGRLGCEPKRKRSNATILNRRD